MTLTFLVALTSAFSEARVDESAMISSGPYSPECVEKLFGNSELIPNRGYEAAKRGQRSPDRLPLGAKEECSRHLLLFSKQFRKMNSPKFACKVFWEAATVFSHSPCGERDIADTRRWTVPPPLEPRPASLVVTR